MARTTDSRRRVKGRRALVFRLAALAFSLALSLIVAELGVRIVAPQNLQGSGRIRSPERRVLIYRAGATMRTQLGDKVVYNSFNRHHLRGAEIGERRPRVLCVGDSFTVAALLDEEETFVRLLEQRARAEFGSDSFELLNGGGGGWGTSQYVAFIEEFGARIDPDMIVVFFNGCDVFLCARSLI